jgi:hypothetical protein
VFSVRVEIRLMVDFLIGLAFFAMVVTPAIVASYQLHRSKDNEV